MDFPLQSKTTNCRNCYKCIRNCPVKAISFFENKASIISDECILCGNCYLVCPQGVKVIRNDIRKVKEFLLKGEKVVISLAPSFVSNYEGYSLNSFKNVAKKIGILDVEETAVGATLVKKRYDQMLSENRDIIISSCCYSVNLLIEKYYPEAIKYLADVLSPMLAHGKDIKARYGADTKVVFIGPCIAKKYEADVNKEYIDAALSYEEWDNLLNSYKQTMEKDDHLYIEKSKARLFPTCGGILKTMEKSNNDYQYLAIDGVDNIKRALEDILNGKIHHCFIEMSACSGSCVNGPLVDKFHRSVLNGTLLVNNASGKEDFDCYKINEKDIDTTYKSYNITASTPSEKEINEMLKKMGKEKLESRLDCGSCGYPSCRDKAIAIIQGKAIKEMCLPYLMEKANSLSDKLVNASVEGLMVVDEDLNIKLINKALCKIVNVYKPEDVLNKKVFLIFDAQDFIDCLQTKKNISKVTYLSEYGKYIEMSILYDESYHLLITICKDITATINAKEEKENRINKTVQLTEEILMKNLAAVQEIASLLGENAASTKVALNRIKDTIKDDE